MVVAIYYCLELCFHLFFVRLSSGIHTNLLKNETALALLSLLVLPLISGTMLLRSAGAPVIGGN
jgi:hypothetical protein